MSDFDDFMNIFRPQDTEEEAKELALTMWKMHKAFIEQGFTVEQAFDMTKIAFASACSKA